MHSSSIASNPFALLMEPEAVLAAVNGSDRLGRLRSRIWRPLDKPVFIEIPDVPGAVLPEGE